MRLFFFVFVFWFVGCFSSYADEHCSHNKDILEYENKIKKSMEDSNAFGLSSSSNAPITSGDIQEALGEVANDSSQEKGNSIDAADKLHAKMRGIFDALPLDCAERLVGQGVDNYLFMAGFPELITSITPDRVVDSLEDIFLYGDHKYFVKNNERILDFLQGEEKKQWFFTRLFQDMDRWYKVHDFALAAKFSLEEGGDLAEMKLQATRAYNPLDFALYLPVWQGQERREQFSQLCLELGCKLDEFYECSPGKVEDLWTVKANYIASSGDIVKVGEQCAVSANNNRKYQKLLPLLDEYPLNYAFNFRKIGILNSNCVIGVQTYYIEQHDFAGADSCGSNQ